MHTSERSLIEGPRSSAVVLAWILLAAGGCDAPSPEMLAPTAALEGTSPRTADTGGTTAAESPALALPFARSGARLKAQHFAAADVELFRNFEDSERGTLCAWALAAKGNDLRCLPALSHPIRFLDAQCTQAVAVTSAWIGPSSAEGDHAERQQAKPGDFITGIEPQRVECGAKLPRAGDVYRLGEALDRVVALYERGAAGCVRAGNGGNYGVRHAVLQPEADFVSGTLTSIPTGGGLTVQRVLGADGSQQTLALAGANGALCRLLPEGPCVAGRVLDYARPSAKGISFYDQECSSSGAAQSQICGDPTYAITREAGQVRAIFPLTRSSDAMDRAPYTCGAQQLPPANVSNRFTPGPDAKAALPTGKRIRLGSGPLHREQLVAVMPEGVVPLEKGEALRNEKGQECAIFPAADGTYRCYPDEFRGTFPTSTRFADPDCQVSLFGSYVRRPVAELIVMNKPKPTVRGPDWETDKIDTLWTLKVYVGPMYGIASTTDGRAPTCTPVEPATIGPEGLGHFAPPFLMLDKQLPLSVLPEVEAVTR